MKAMKMLKVSLMGFGTPCSMRANAPEPETPADYLEKKNKVETPRKPPKAAAAPAKAPDRAVLKEKSVVRPDNFNVPVGGFTAADVAKHNTKEDCWIVINGHIWDVTEWLDNHPGGPEVLLEMAGQDASDAYNAQHFPNLVTSQLTFDKYKGKLNSIPAMDETQDAPMADAGLNVAEQAPGAPKATPTPTKPSIGAQNEPMVDTPSRVAGKSDIATEPIHKGGMKLRKVIQIERDPPVPPDPNDLRNLPPIVLKRPAKYALRMNHSWTITDGTYDPMPQNKRRKRDVPYPAFVNHTFRSMNALSGLQLSHNSPIPMTALDIANDHVWKCMPREVSLYLYMPAPNGPALWSPDEEAVKAMYEKMEDKDYFLAKDDNTTEMEYRGYINIKRRPWIIWPLYVEDQWGCDYVTVVWYSNSSDELCALFDQVVAYAIIDPRRSLEPDVNGRYGPVPERMERIRTRLFEFLRRAGMNTENARALDLRCPPMEFGETSSGERCFAVVKALMNQIMDWCLNGMTFCPETTLKSMHQWVLPFQQRVELTGINAWVLMASLDYDARITVEAILPSTETAVVADGKMKMLINYDLAGPCTQPSLASWDYLLPADHKYVAPAQT